MLLTKSNNLNIAIFKEWNDSKVVDFLLSGFKYSFKIALINKRKSRSWC